jgi:hypothetical protein
VVVSFDDGRQVHLELAGAAARWARYLYCAMFDDRMMCRCGW